MENNQELLTERIFPTLLKFAIPFLIANLLQALYGAADLVIIGYFADAAGVAAVATGSQVMQTITGIVVGLTTGGTVLIGQYLGANKKEAISEIVGNMISLFAVIACILTVIMAFGANPIAQFMHTPVEALKDTIDYINICVLGILFITGYNSVSGILRGLGDSKTPLIFVAIACMINIIVDIILVGVLKWGARGAAVATITAQGLSFLLALVYLKKKGVPFEFGRQHIRFVPVKIKAIFKVGLPIALQDALVNISFLIITAIINSRGLIDAAAVGVVEKVIVFAMLPPTAFASAIAAMGAQNMGAGKVERAKKCLYTGIGCSAIFGLLCLLYGQGDSSLLMGMFTKDQEVIVASSLYFRSYSIDCLMVCVIFCMNGFLCGCGHSLFAMIHSLIATFLVRIPIAYGLSRLTEMTLYEIGLAAPIASMVSIVICVIYMKTGRWKKTVIE